MILRVRRPPAVVFGAAAAGINFRYNTTVTELVHNGGVVSAVGTDTGERFAADAVVLTSELPDAYRMLGRAPRRMLPLHPAPSAVMTRPTATIEDPQVLDVVDPAGWAKLTESPSQQRQTVVVR